MKVTVENTGAAPLRRRRNDSKFTDSESSHESSHGPVKLHNLKLSLSLSRSGPGPSKLAGLHHDSVEISRIASFTHCRGNAAGGTINCRETKRPPPSGPAVGPGPDARVPSNVTSHWLESVNCGRSKRW